MRLLNLPILLTCFLLNSVGWAQDEKLKSGEGASKSRTTTTPGRSGASGKAGTSGVVRPSSGVARPGFGVDSTQHARPGDQYFTPLCSIRPRRLAAGQSGFFHVTVALRPDIIVLPNAFIELALNPEGSPFTLGVPVRTPARKMKSGPRAGQEIYDDTIEFKVALTIAKDAEMARFMINGRMALDLTRASTGESMGGYSRLVQFGIRVGSPLPNPTIVMRPTAAGRNEHPNTQSDGIRPSVVEPTKSSDVGSATSDSASSEPSARQGTDPGNPESAPGTPADVPGLPGNSVFLGGGACALVILFLLVRRFRK